MAKSFGLREFQQKLLDRIQLQEAAGDRISTLGIQIGRAFWLVEMEDISEVLTLPTVATVPLTQPWYRGVANVRGNLYGIADLAAFMGQGETPEGGQCRVLLAAQKFSCNAGLLVTRVLGLRDTLKWQQEMKDGEVHWRDEQSHLWRKLDMSQLLQQPDFLQIGI